MATTSVQPSVFFAISTTAGLNPIQFVERPAYKRDMQEHIIFGNALGARESTAFSLTFKVGG